MAFVQFFVRVMIIIHHDFLFFFNVNYSDKYISGLFDLSFAKRTLICIVVLPTDETFDASFDWSLFWVVSSPFGTINRFVTLLATVMTISFEWSAPFRPIIPLTIIVVSLSILLVGISYFDLHNLIYFRFLDFIGSFKSTMVRFDVFLHLTQ